MISRLAVLLALILSLTSPALATSHLLGGVFVGNGGEGQRLGSGVVLRDFAQAQPGFTPWIGTELDPQLYHKVASMSFLPHSIPTAALARKIADLDREVPPLGSALLAVFDFYHWQFVDSGVLPSTDLNPNRQAWLQLAVRKDHIIRLDQRHWEKMPEEQQVGLLIHEVLSALLIPHCVSENHCFQSSESVRQVTRLAFDQNKIRDLRKRRLAIPWEASPEELRQRAAYRIRALDARGGILFDLTSYLPRKFREAHLRSISRSYCLQAIKGQAAFLELGLRPEKSTVQVLPYPIASIHEQISVRVLKSEPRESVSHRLSTNSIFICEREFLEVTVPFLSN